MSGKESKPKDEITSDGFGSTTWSLILEAGRSEDGGPALERLCRKHWRPIYVFVRRSGLSPVDSEDATQEFFIEGANPSREIIANLYHVLRRLGSRGPIEMPITEIAELVPATKNSMAVGSALYLLERANFIQREYRQGSRTYTTRLVEPIKPLDELPIAYTRTPQAVWFIT